MGNMCGGPGLEKPKGKGKGKGKAEESKFKFHNGYKDAAELSNFDDFFLPETSSECKKCLTREIWDEYKDQKCDAGVSFKTCVFSGIANQDSGIGLYAGSHNAYTKFNKLFD